jgi:choline dehydrogenase-like flavoprotein
MNKRRTFLDWLGRLGLSGTVAPLVAACGTTRPPPPSPPSEHFDLVVVGSGFGGTLTALTVAYTMESRHAGKPAGTPLRILMLERGTWWTTPMETLQDKQVRTRDFLIWKGQPTQEWSSLNDYRGMIDLVRRCRYSDTRPQGLYDFTAIGKRGLFNLDNDGVSVLRASGVGGGSLIYSKILIRPPEKLFDDPRWTGGWHGSAGAALRKAYYRRAVDAVSRGVETLMPQKFPGEAPGSGVSNIITRAPALAPAAVAENDPLIPPTDGQRQVLRIRIRDGRKLEPRERELIDRARVFQTAISQLTPHYGTVDLSINDMSFPTAAKGATPKPPGTNYCERHGRCNIGCLPGAGQTLNKQLMRAVYGQLDPELFDPGNPQDGPCLLKRVALQLRALAQVDHISETADGSYLIHYAQRQAADPTAPPASTVISADRVVLAAGSLGTTELLLRSRQFSVDTKGAEGLRALSEKLGFGFSPNGDHIALLGETKERVNLTTGPVTTSFGQFKADAPQARGFHNVEDQGVPRSLSALTGYGFGVMQKLAHDDDIDGYLEALAGSLKAWQDIAARRPGRTYPASSPADMSADRPESEDELSVKMMCVVAQGKDDANGQFRLEGDRLRVARVDGKAFHDDEIYASIRRTLDELAKKLRPEGSTAGFISPLSDVALPGQKAMVLTSHPLGGCLMGASADTGVVDEWGRVYRSEPAQAGLYRGLYVADGSVIPTALGVNPALTISAVALRTADKILAEWNEIPARQPRAATPLQCKA